MADIMRFGVAERMVIGLWVLLATPLIIVALSTAIPQPDPVVETVVRWWANAGVATALLITGMPGFRYVYQELVAPRLPSFGTNT